MHEWQRQAPLHLPASGVKGLQLYSRHDEQMPSSNGQLEDAVCKVRETAPASVTVAGPEQGRATGLVPLRRGGMHVNHSRAGVSVHEWEQEESEEQELQQHPHHVSQRARQQQWQQQRPA